MDDGSDSVSRSLADNFAVPTQPTQPIRLAELMAALSIATDLGMGQPMEYAMTTCIVAVRLGEVLKLSEADLRDAYYEALLRYIGCNADTYWLASIIGDELALRAEFAKIDTADNGRVLGLMLKFIQQANAGANPIKLAQAMVSGLAQLPQVNSSFFPGHCEVAQRLASRMGFEDSFVQTVGQIYARWDGKGVPSLKGDAISPAMQVVTLAQDVVTFFRLGGVDAAMTMARERNGKAHAPKAAEAFCQHAQTVCAGLDIEPAWETVLAMEPGPHRALSEAEFDAACEAIADFTDLKSPFLLGHSRAVAALSFEAAHYFGLQLTNSQSLRRAAWLHDVGRVGVSAAIWGRPGPLTEREWDKVRLHPYYTERVLAKPTALAELGKLAALHHERCDGSGYHRGLPANMLSPAARILGAADVYCAMLETRPHRPARTAEAASDELRAEARTGRLDPDAVNAVLSAAGQTTQSLRASEAFRLSPTTNLSEREVEVLRLLARGNTMKQIAAALVISYKTVDRHVQNVYTKIGVNTRAGATLWAVERGLV